MTILDCSKKLLKLDKDIRLVDVLKQEEREKRRQYYKEFKKKNPNYYKEKRAQERKNNFEKELFNQTKSFAKKQGIIFTLIIDDIIIPKTCPLTETEITKSVGEGRMLSNPYIYRKDESIGYIKENIIITCILANHLRSCATKEQIVAFAKNIKKMF